jgi:hypothetical protein
MQKHLTPSFELIKPSINLVREHFVAFTYLIMLPGLTYAIGGVLAQTVLQADGTIIIHQKEIVGFAIMLLAAVWMTVNLGPMTYFQLRATKKQPESLVTYYQAGLPFSLKILGLYIAYAVAVIVGLILLIIPGLIMLRRYLLAPFYVVDKRLPVFTAMKQSAQDTKPVSGYIWGLIGLQLIAALLASVAAEIPVIGIVIGQLLTFTLTFTAVLRYREVAS